MIPSRFNKKIIPLALAALIYPCKSYAREYHVSNFYELRDLMFEVAHNREDDVIYVDFGLYDVYNPLEYRPDPEEHYSLTIKPSKPGSMVILQRKIDTTIFIADLSQLSPTDKNKIKIELDSLYMGDTISSSPKKNPFIEIKGKNITVNIKNSQFYGGFIKKNKPTIDLHVDGSDIFLKNNIFYRTASEGNSSTLSVSGERDSILLHKNYFYSNKSYKGTIYTNTKDSEILLISNKFYNNIVYYELPDSVSGLLSEGENNSVYVLDNYFFGNISNVKSACISVNQKGGYIKVFHNTFLYNYSKKGNGSSLNVLLDNDSKIDIVNNRFGYNVSNVGGALYLKSKGSTTFIGNNIFYENHTYSDNDAAEFGGAVFLSSESSFVNLLNNTLYANYTYGKGGGIYISVNDSADNEISTVNIANNIVWANYSLNKNASIEDLGYDIYIRNSIGSVNLLNNDYEFLTFSSEESISQENNLHVDPQFKNPYASDFHLLENSPCIDRGVILDEISVPDEFLEDIDDEDRVYGESIDIGADEFHPDDNEQKENKIGELLIDEEKGIKKEGLFNKKIKLICLHYYPLKEIVSYKWDINNDGNIDYETEVPYLELNGVHLDKENVKCIVQYSDGSEAVIY